MLTLATAQFPFFAPLAGFLLVPLSIPFTYLESLLLCGAIPSTLAPACSWTDLPLPIPSPFQLPNTPGQLCALLRQHRDSGFTRSGTLLILIQEVKRDIIYRWMNLPPSATQVANPQRLMAHVESTLHRLQSYFQYTGLAKFGEAIEMIQQMRNLNFRPQMSKFITMLPPPPSLPPLFHTFPTITWIHNQK